VIDGLTFHNPVKEGWPTIRQRTRRLTIWLSNRQKAEPLVSRSPQRLQLGNISGNAASEVNMQRWL
jgi:hypothetical protein